MATDANSATASNNGVVDKSKEVVDNEGLQKAIAAQVAQGPQPTLDIQDLLKEMLSPPCHEQTWELVKATSEMQRRVEKLLNIVVSQSRLIEELQKK